MAKCTQTFMATSNSPELPRVTIDVDEVFFRVPLSQILREAGCLVEHCELDEDGGREFPPPDLMVLQVRPGDGSSLERLSRLRRRTGFREVPILGVTILDRNARDLPLLRAHGIVGLIDKGSIPEHVAFRVNQIVRPKESGRRYERAPCFFPVDVHQEGTITTEYALNLSVGGILITSSEPVDLNTDLRFRFRLGKASDDVIETRGRVVYRKPGTNSAALYQLGVFFYPLDAATQRVIEREVSSLLTG